MSILSDHRTLGAALLLAAFTAGPCLAKDLEVAAEVWSSSAAAGANAPEREECLFLHAGQKARDEKVCSEDGAMAMRPSFGVAFSGGGTRSASATLGQLRALHELGLDRRLRYISAVSGGSWAVVPYTFLPPEFDDAAFLGRYVPPEEINDAKILAFEDSKLGSAITKADLARGFLDAARHGGFDENYAAALERVFLEPFGLGGSTPPRFFSLDENSLAPILARNPKLAADDFYLVRPGRPFLIVGGAIVPKRSNDELDQYPFDMTPLYVGTPVSATIESRLVDRPVGGGYVEAFAYDSDLVERDADGTPTGRCASQWMRLKRPCQPSSLRARFGAAPGRENASNVGQSCRWRGTGSGLGWWLKRGLR